MNFRIFYLDDEEDLCDVFSDTFASPEVEISTFTDPAKLIESTKLNPPDLIFVDYRLPATTGDQVAQSLDSNVPKFLVTGDITVETVYQFDGVFSKPYSRQDILNVISEYQSRARAR